MKLKITFKVQSLSDIITNSSSEVFLRIDSKDEKTHNEIYKVMQELFPGNDYEMSPGVWEYTEDGEYSISLEVPYVNKIVALNQTDLEVLKESLISLKTK